MKKILSSIVVLALCLCLLPMPKAEACKMPDISKEDIAEFKETLNKVYGKGYPTGEVTFSKATEGAVMCGLCSAVPGYYSIGIGKIDAINGRAVQDSYVIVLGGTEVVPSDENAGFEEDKLAAYNKDNLYLQSVIREVNKLPKGSKLYFYGYSLGGMIIQQAMASPSIKNDYIVVNGVAYGSPLVTLKRIKITILEDKSDMTPIMAPRFVLGNRMWRMYDSHIRRDGGYKTTIGSHAMSYIDSPIWDNIDIMGKVNGHGTITLNMDNYKTFKA